MRKLLLLLGLLACLPASALTTYVGIGAVAQSVTSQTITVNCPASPSVGDVQFLYETFDNTGAVVAPSGGFTAAETNQSSARWYYRVITTGSEANPTVATGTTTSFQAVCLSLRGVNTSSPINQAVADSGSSSTSLRVPQITVSGNNQVLLYGGRAAETWTSLATVTNFTEILDSPYTGTAIAVDYWIQTTATNIGSGQTVAITGGSTSTNIVSIIAINPADPVFNGTISTQSSTEGTSVGSVDFSTFFTNVTSYSVQSCTLPHGLSLNTGSGVVTGTPDRPLSVTGCVIRATNSSGTADSNSFNWTITAPSGKQYVTLASIDPTSFCQDFNDTQSPDIVAGDILKIDTATAPSLFTANPDKSGVLDVEPDCSIIYAGDSTRQLVTYDVWDTSAVAYMSGGPGNVWFNNQPPIGPEGQLVFIVPYNSAMTPTDLSAVCTDPENDAMTVTAVDSLPAGLLLNGSGCTPSSASCLHGTTTFKGVTPDVRLQCTDITGESTIWQ